MSGNAFVKFSKRQKDESGKPLSWGRADTDGAPYRGTPLLLTDEEYEDRVVRVKDAHNGLFDLNKPAENRRYLAVIEEVVHGLAQLVYLKRRWSKTKRKPLIYMEWVKVFMQDGAPRG